jgi:hypothetical protein
MDNKGDVGSHKAFVSFPFAAFAFGFSRLRVKSDTNKHPWDPAQPMKPQLPDVWEISSMLACRFSLDFIGWKGVLICGFRNFAKHAFHGTKICTKMNVSCLALSGLIVPFLLCFFFMCCLALSCLANERKKCPEKWWVGKPLIKDTRSKKKHLRFDS